MCQECTSRLIVILLKRHILFVPDGDFTASDIDEVIWQSGVGYSKYVVYTDPLITVNVIRRMQ